MTTNTRTRVDEAADASHIATARAAALGGLLANLLHAGWSPESLTRLIENTITANTEVDKARQTVHEEAERARAKYGRYLASRGLA